MAVRPAGSVTTHWFEEMSTPMQFSILVGGVFLFFGVHNYLQEAIMAVPNFQFGVMLGYLEVFGVTICSFLERKYVAQETQRVAPLSSYTLLTFCLLSSSSLSNLALNFINFPTKVVFRSCKVSEQQSIEHTQTQLLWRTVFLLFLCCAIHAVITFQRSTHLIVFLLKIICY